MLLNLLVLDFCQVVERDTEKFIMFRLSPRRNQRSKGFKVKHALQICLLLGVTIWLLYQVRHSQDKKASFGKSTKNGNEIVKLGRKGQGFLPQLEESSIKHAGYKEEESKDEEEQNTSEEIDNAGRDVENEIDVHHKDHGEEEIEQNAGIGGVYNEIDVHHKDHSEEETQNRWNSVDGEKEKEENKEHIREEKEKDKEFEESREKENEQESEKSREKDNEENNEKERESKEFEEITEQQREERENEESNDKEREDKGFEESKEKEGENKEFDKSREQESEEKKNEDSKEKQNEDRENEDMKENRREGNNETYSREKETEEKDGKIVMLGTSEDQVQDGSDTNSKAREEHYKGDDASSAVIHENQNVSAGNEQGSWENSKDTDQVENREKNYLDQEKPTNTTEVVDNNPDVSDTNMREIENFEKHDSTNATSSEDGGNKGNQSEQENGSHPSSDKTTSNGDDSTLQNVMLQQTDKSDPAASNEQQDSSGTPYTRMGNGDVPAESNRTSETENNSAPEVLDGNNDAIQSEKSNTSPGFEGTEKMVLSPGTGDSTDDRDKEQIVASDSLFQQEKDETSKTDNNADTGHNESDNNNPKDTNEETDAGQKESVDPQEEKEASSNSANNESENANPKETNEETDARQKESVDSQEEKDASSSSDSNGNVSQNDPVNTYDSSITQEEKEARTDLETLPETRAEGNNNDDIAAE